MPQKFIASDEILAWARSLSGMLTTIRTKYGSVAEMVESPDWDESKTLYALTLIEALNEHVSAIHEELSRHVTEKFGKDPR